MNKCFLITIPDRILFFNCKLQYLYSTYFLPSTLMIYSYTAEYFKSNQILKFKYITDHHTFLSIIESTTLQILTIKQ